MVHRTRRGCYISDDEELVIWVGEEEHLRVMSKRTGKSLDKVFSTLQTALGLLDEGGVLGLPGFARSVQSNAMHD